MFPQFIKKTIEHLLNSRGYELCELNPNRQTDPFQSQKILAPREANQIIFDVGACVGDTVEIYRSHFPSAQIFAFEPFPESREKLSLRFSSDKGVKLIPLAAAEEKGTAKFFISEHRGANSLFERPKDERRYYGEKAIHKESIEVTLTTIDSFCQENEIKHIDILKMDIQGAEVKALKGAQGMLSETKIDIIYCEVEYVPFYEGGALFFEVCAFLDKFDYSLFNLYNPFYASNGQLKYGDAIFVSKRTRAEVLDRFEDEPY